jgi:hypothetical protein
MEVKIGNFVLQCFFLFHIRSFCRRYGLMVATNVDFWNKNDSPGAQNIRGSDVL